MHLDSKFKYATGKSQIDEYIPTNLYTQIKIFLFLFRNTNFVNIIYYKKWDNFF